METRTILTSLSSDLVAACGPDSVVCRDGTSCDLGGGETPPGRVQLFPCGVFAATDGRPGTLEGVSAASWRCTAEDAAALIGLWRRRKSRTVIDYEHQTMNAEKKRPARAGRRLDRQSCLGRGARPVRGCGMDGAGARIHTCRRIPLHFPDLHL